MAFTDALDLRTAVIELVRDASITDVWPRLVKLGETTINRRVRAREQIVTASVAIANGFAFLPADYMEVIALYDASGREMVQQPLGMAVKAGTRAFYAVDIDRIISKQDGDFTLKYYAALPSLSGSMTATNWALWRWPQLYLYAIGLEAARYLRDTAAASEIGAAMEAEIASVAAQDTAARFGNARVRFGWVTP